MAGDDRGNGRTRAVIRDMNKVESKRQLQLLSHEVRYRAGSSRGEGEFGRTGFDQRDKLRKRPCRH